MNQTTDARARIVNPFPRGAPSACKQLNKQNARKECVGRAQQRSGSGCCCRQTRKRSEMGVPSKIAYPHPPGHVIKKKQAMVFILFCSALSWFSPFSFPRCFAALGVGARCRLVCVHVCTAPVISGFLLSTHLHSIPHTHTHKHTHVLSLAFWVHTQASDRVGPLSFSLCALAVHRTSLHTG